MTVARHAVTADGLFERPDDSFPYPAARGELIRMTYPGFDHAIIEMPRGSALTHHVTTHPLGPVCGVKTEVLPARHPDTVLTPDAAFRERERPAPRESPAPPAEAVLERGARSDRRRALPRRRTQHGRHQGGGVAPSPHACGLRGPEGRSRHEPRVGPRSAPSRPIPYTERRAPVPRLPPPPRRRVRRLKEIPAAGRHHAVPLSAPRGVTGYGPGAPRGADALPPSRTAWVPEWTPSSRTGSNSDLNPWTSPKMEDFRRQCQRYRITHLYHLTHIANLRSIWNLGLLAHNRAHD